MGHFDGKVAIVTGAGRMRGIGRSAALAFAEEGADVVVTGTGRDPSTFPVDEQAANWRDVESVAEEIQQMGRRALAVTVDVANAHQVDDMVQRAVNELGGADILVNNASAPRLAAWAPLNELTEEAWRGVLDIKLTGTFLCTRAVTNVLMQQGKPGSIVNVISVEAKISRENDIAYATDQRCPVYLHRQNRSCLGPPRHTDERRQPRHHRHLPQRRPIRLPSQRLLARTHQHHTPRPRGPTRRDGPLHRVALHQGCRVHRRASHRDGRRAGGLSSR